MNIEPSAVAAEPIDALLPPGRVAIGAWQPGAPMRMEPLQALEQQLGTRLRIVAWYQGWGAENRALDTRLLDAVAAHGALPSITWEPWDYRRGGTAQPEYRLARIAAGAFDAYLRAWASGLRAHGRPVLLRVAHEMNLPAYPWSIGQNGNRAADFLAAWRHKVGVFRDEGATNAHWMWSPNVPTPTSTPYDACFPGDDVVDIVGVDGFNAGTAADWGGWLRFDEIFSPAYAALQHLTARPIVIAETGCAEQGGDKAQWIADALGVQLLERFPAVRALIWFNEAREADWRIESSPASLAAFRAGVQGARYGP